MWLSTTGLACAPTGPLDVMGLIVDLGFLQIDTVRNVTRAHHHILWSRNQNYREKLLWPLLGEQRLLFEHFTHDASLIPMAFFPMWRMQFSRMGEKVQNKWYRIARAGEVMGAVYRRIEAEGPLSTHAFDTRVQGKAKMWARPPHKKALERLWYAGELATAYRRNFVKYYDLGERVFPRKYRDVHVSDENQIDWLCRQALGRLGVASVGEIKRFWDVLSIGEVKNWVENSSDLVDVDVAGSDQSLTRGLALDNVEQVLAETGAPGSRVRIINPFDPAIRDRKRLQRLFGFEYRNEMFVPKEKRKWGYYVYPLLEKDRFIGRIEIRAERAAGRMFIVGFWSEPGVRWGGGRNNRLQSELERFASFAGVGAIEWQCRQPR